jgi:general secretion pathway protein A
MYQHFYGLRDLPFELTPNPRYLFLTPQHREALSSLEYGLSSAKAVTVLVGEAGTGKTTVITAALESERCRDVRCVYLNNPALTREEFIQTLASQFRLGPQASTSKAALLDELSRTLRERRAQGQITALVIDEAQSLSLELLEEVRLLANTETATEKLLPIVLAGQPELRDRLNDPRLRQLKQRITIRCEIRPLSVHETAAYMAMRIRTAGGDAATLFSREAVLLIHELAGGLPRTINVICDNALLTGCALGRQPVDRQMILDVAHDFDPPNRPPTATACESRPRHHGNSCPRRFPTITDLILHWLPRVHPPMNERVRRRTSAKCSQWVAELVSFPSFDRNPHVVPRIFR